MRRRFVTLDVFTSRRFAGNPLAVVLDAEGLDTAAMQTIAREFNHPETVFVRPPADPAHRANLRIFTPGAVVGVVLWLGISYGFGFYLGQFNNYAMTYGALGGAIIFLTWLWLSSMALLFGAEINDVICHLREHPNEPSPGPNPTVSPTDIDHGDATK